MISWFSLLLLQLLWHLFYRHLKLHRQRYIFFFQAEDGIRVVAVTGVQTCALPISYPLLPFNLRPTGTGPWKVSQAQPGKELVFEAFAGYHEGPPKTSRIVIDLSTPPSGEVSRSIATGGTDIQQLPEQFDSDTWKALKRNPDLHFVRYAMLGYLAIQFNLRPGHIFADPNLREALDRCIDKPDAVEAATRGLGVPINSDVAPSSWAYNNALSSRPRDPVAAR